MQTQSLPPVPLARLVGDSNGRLVEKNGYACLYDVEIDRGFYMMELAKKCFAKSTGDPAKIVILSQHDSWTPIGKAASFTEQEIGLDMNFLLNPDVQAGAETISNIDSGILTGLSVGFDVIKVETEKRGGEGAAGYEVDRIVEGRLREVSVCTFPAIDGARIQASDSTASNTLTTFAVNDGEPSQERLCAGEHVRLATFFFKGRRVRPNLSVEVKATVSNDEPPAQDETLADADTPPQPQAETPPEPPVELTEDQRYPGAREALLEILKRD